MSVTFQRLTVHPAHGNKSVSQLACSGFKSRCATRPLTGKGESVSRPLSAFFTHGAGMVAPSTSNNHHRARNVSFPDTRHAARLRDGYLENHNET